LAEFVVSRAAGLLLHDLGQGLHHSANHSLSRDTATHITSDAFHDTAAIHGATSDAAAANPATVHAATTTSQTRWASGSQLRGWCHPHLVCGQARMVLHQPSCRLRDTATYSAAYFRAAACGDAN